MGVDVVLDYNRVDAVSRSEMMTSGKKLRSANALAIIFAGLLFFQTISAQLLENSFHKIINAHAWSSEELTDLMNGEVVVRSLETTEKQELASIGVLRIINLPRISMSTFRESLSQKGSGPMKAGGRFSDPPMMDDLRDLELSKNSVEQLRKCTIGKCDLNLSAEAIRRFQNEVDWNSSDAGVQTSRLMQSVLLDYVRGYLAGGDRALGTYGNRRKTVDLAESHRSLLLSSSFISDLAPEFAEYLKGFPSTKLERVESSMHWSVVDFGLKPSITVSHASAYTQVTGEAEQLYVASKQIYASRYLDSSLTFTLLLRVSTEIGVNTYLVFVDRSRSDALEGPLGGFARDMVQKESVERIENLLDKAHLRLLAAAKSEANTNSASEETEDPSAGWMTIDRRRIAWALGCIAVVIALVALWRRRRK